MSRKRALYASPSFLSSESSEDTSVSLSCGFSTQLPRIAGCEPNREHLEAVETEIEELRPVIDPVELRRAVKEEWDKITLEEINKAIASMPDRGAAVNEHNGLPTPF